MESPFAITTTTQHMPLGVTRQGAVVFNVYNAGAETLHGRALVHAGDPGTAGWFRIESEAERPFGVKATEQVTVQIAPPADAAPGRYTFRLDVVSIEDPDEHYSEGPAVTFDVAPPPPPKPFPWWIVAVAGAVVVAVVLAIVLWPRRVTLPEVAGQTQAAAEALLDEACGKKACLEVSIERRANDLYEAGKAIGTEPRKETKVRRGSAVILFVSRGPDKVKVPAVDDRAEDIARNMIRERGLVPSDSVEKENHGTIEKGRVTRTEPPAGESVDRGTRVTLVISLGKGEVEIPSVVGMRPTDAVTKLQQAGLNVNATQKRVSSPSVAKDRAIGTEPAAGIRVTDETLVTVVVSRGPVCVVQEQTVTPSRLTFHPLRFKGDREFMGHGPEVNVRVDVYVEDNKLKLKVYMRAREKTGGDYHDTWAESNRVWTIAPPPSGTEIRAVIGSRTSSHSYTDNDGAVDSFLLGPEGPASRLDIIGDTSGNDVGSSKGDTGVTVYFNPIRYQVIQNTGCVAARVALNAQEIEFHRSANEIQQAMLSMSVGDGDISWTQASKTIDLKSGTSRYKLDQQMSWLMTEKESFRFSVVGAFAETYEPTNNWGAGAHQEKSDTGDYTLHYTVNVNWLQ